VPKNTWVTLRGVSRRGAHVLPSTQTRKTIGFRKITVTATGLCMACCRVWANRNHSVVVAIGDPISGGGIASHEATAVADDSPAPRCGRHHQGHGVLEINFGGRFQRLIRWCWSALQEPGVHGFRVELVECFDEASFVSGPTGAEVDGDAVLQRLGGLLGLASMAAVDCVRCLAAAVGQGRKWAVRGEMGAGHRPSVGMPKLAAALRNVTRTGDW
jgi:hypothetical protein